MIEIGNLLERATRLTARCKDMSARMVDSAALLERGEAGGMCALSSELAALESDLQQLHAEAKELVGAEYQDGLDIARLRQLLESISEQKSTRRAEFERRRDEASRILGKCARLARGTEGDYPPLQPCKQAAVELASSLSACDEDSLPPGILGLLSGDHPLAALIQLVEGADNLADDDWERLRSVIEGAYGPSLATAASRGRIGFADETVTTPRHTPVAEETPKLGPTAQSEVECDTSDLPCLETAVDEPPALEPLSQTPDQIELEGPAAPETAGGGGAAAEAAPAPEPASPSEIPALEAPPQHRVPKRRLPLRPPSVPNYRFASKGSFGDLLKPGELGWPTS